MYNNQTFNEQLSLLLKPLIISGKYKNEDTAIKDIVIDYVERKVKKYKAEIKRLNNKYMMDFENFSKKIKNCALLEEEDDWMDWKAAIEMQKAWKITLQKMINNVYQH
ncbi:MAG: hypothetical protein KAT68_10015 [Bacteroidales bacterium]|nr:hypothetical protein [Bacteroidales bacterium]